MCHLEHFQMMMLATQSMQFVWNVKIHSRIHTLQKTCTISKFCSLKWWLHLNAINTSPHSIPWSFAQTLCCLRANARRCVPSIWSKLYIHTLQYWHNPNHFFSSSWKKPTADETHLSFINNYVKLGERAFVCVWIQNCTCFINIIAWNELFSSTDTMFWRTWYSNSMLWMDEWMNELARGENVGRGKKARMKKGCEDKFFIHNYTWLRNRFFGMHNI